MIVGKRSLAALAVCAVMSSADCIHSEAPFEPIGRGEIVAGIYQIQFSTANGPNPNVSCPLLEFTMSAVSSWQKLGACTFAFQTTNATPRDVVTQGDSIFLRTRESESIFADVPYVIKLYDFTRRGSRIRSGWTSTLSCLQTSTHVCVYEYGMAEWTLQ